MSVGYITCGLMVQDGVRVERSLRDEASEGYPKLSIVLVINCQCCMTLRRLPVNGTNRKLIWIQLLTENETGYYAVLFDSPICCSID